MIDLQEEFANENYKKDQFEIQLSSHILNFSFNQLYKYSEKIQSEYYPNELVANLHQNINQLQNINNIKIESILTFFKLLNEQKLEIQINQYCDLFILAKYFQVNSLQKSLSKFAKSHIKDINFLIYLIQEIEEKRSENYIYDFSSTELENLLISGISECLNNEKFGELPISMVYRIISKSCLSEIDQDLLSDFIGKKRQERYVLYSFLNLQKLSDSKFNELYENYHNEKDSSKYYRYISNHIEYIKQLKETQKQLEEQIRNLEKQFNAQIKQKDDENQELKSKIANFEILNNEIKNTVDRITGEKERIREDNDKLRSQIQQTQIEGEQQKTELNVLKEKNKQLSSKLEQIENESNQLKEKIKKLETENLSVLKDIPYQRDFDGILNYFRKNSRIEDEISVIYSSFGGGGSNYLYEYEHDKRVFYTEHKSNQWIGFQIKKHKMIPSGYTIRTYNGYYHPKSWVIEGSNDSDQWEPIDEQKNCRFLHGPNLVHTFQIQNQKPFKFIRMRLIDRNWGDDTHLAINCIEFYGKILL